MASANDRTSNVNERCASSSYLTLASLYPDLMILTTSSTSFGVGVRFSYPESVIKMLSTHSQFELTKSRTLYRLPSILTPPTLQYFSSTPLSIYFACSGFSRYGSIMNLQK